MPQKQSLENRVENKLSKTSLKDKVKKGISKALLPFVVAGSIGLSGCATTGYGVSSEERLGYKFYDSYGDYKLVQKNNDVWMEKLDGSEAPKQITHTPSTKEFQAIFIAGGTYVIYAEDWGRPGNNNYFIIPKDKDDSNRKEISSDEYHSLIRQRVTGDR